MLLGSGIDIMLQAFEKVNRLWINLFKILELVGVCCFKIKDC